MKSKPVWTLSLLVLAAVAEARIIPKLRQEPLPAPPAQILFSMDPAQSTLHWTLESTLHTVHGTFHWKRGSFRLDPATGKTSGELVADASSGESGNDSRDKKMHREVLESKRYPEVLFRPALVEGKVVRQGASSLQVHGTFVLHGVAHEISVPVHAELEGDHWKGSAKFSVPFVEWGLKNPSNFFLRVNKAVEIDAELSGKLQDSPIS